MAGSPLQVAAPLGEQHDRVIGQHRAHRRGSGGDEHRSERGGEGEQLSGGVHDAYILCSQRAKIRAK